MRELWLPVVGHDERYEVSNLGRVRSRDIISRGRGGKPVLRRGRVLAQSNDKDGYKTVSIHFGEHNQRTSKVHQLVASAFIGPKPNGLEVGHIDGVRGNNAASNLKYTTKRDNQADRIAHGTAPHGTKNPMAKLTAEQVSAIRQAVGSQQAIADVFGVSQSNVSFIRRGLTWTHI